MQRKSFIYSAIFYTFIAHESRALCNTRDSVMVIVKSYVCDINYKLINYSPDIVHCTLLHDS